MKVKQLNLLPFLLVFLLGGCTSHREYYKIAKGGSGNLSVDYAQCEYQAQMNTQAPQNTNVQINVDNRRGNGSTNYSNLYNQNTSKPLRPGAAFLQGVRESELRRRPQMLTDLCLKSRGWNWKIIED